ncbi:hypothetical protein [Aquiflexum gelatinilyticum]|uniref:Uncharacterized protein n=1 Tax=Aquiflexum gelatinilyticum TaxID=2961943 RepID=A0A9X2SXS8_9BACT|nr:hypothetical protein [Aquiflexum gelatinilyticum]MCR9014119.1 hypothetical protein [Aquiflexum gelatinilyticum]
MRKKHRQVILDGVFLFMIALFNNQMGGKYSDFSSFDKQPRSGRNISSPVQGASLIFIPKQISMHRSSGFQKMSCLWFLEAKKKILELVSHQKQGRFN